MKDQNEKKGFLLYADQMSIFDILEDNEAGILIKHVFKYVNGINSELNDRTLKIAFEPIRNHLKRDSEKWKSVVSERKKEG